MGYDGLNINEYDDLSVPKDCNGKYIKNYAKLIKKCESSNYDNKSIKGTVKYLNIKNQSKNTIQKEIVFFKNDNSNITLTDMLTFYDK